MGMAGRYTGSYPDRPNGWRAARTWLTSVELHSSNASPGSHLGLYEKGDNSGGVKPHANVATPHQFWLCCGALEDTCVGVA